MIDVGSPQAGLLIRFAREPEARLTDGNVAPRNCPVTFGSVTRWLAESTEVIETFLSQATSREPGPSSRFSASNPLASRAGRTLLGGSVLEHLDP